MTTRRNELASCLAEIDQCLAKAKDAIADPIDGGERQSALDFLIEFQETKRRVEVQLRGE